MKGIERSSAYIRQDPCSDAENHQQEACSPYEISYCGHFPHGRAAVDFSSLPSTGTDEK
jgi:hypothetical protein